jgi:hypothetical protein
VFLCATRRASGPDERINFRDVVNVISGLALDPPVQGRGRLNTRRSPSL